MHRYADGNIPVNRYTYLQRHKFRSPMEFDANRRAFSGRGIIGADFTRGYGRYCQQTLTSGQKMGQTATLDCVQYTKLDNDNLEHEHWGLYISRGVLNVLSQPINFSHADWTKTDVIITAGKADMYGGVEGFWVEQDAIGATDSFLLNTTAVNPASKKYRISVDFKAVVENHTCRVEIGNGGNGVDDTKTWDVIVSGSEHSRFHGNYTFNATAGLLYVKVYPDLRTLPANNGSRTMVFDVCITEAKCDAFNPPVGAGSNTVPDRLHHHVGNQCGLRGDIGTLSFWFRPMIKMPGSADYLTRNLIKVNYWDDITGGLSLYASNNNLLIKTANGSGNKITTITGALSLTTSGTYFHFTICWKAGQIDFYLGDTLIATESEVYVGIASPVSAQIEYGSILDNNAFEASFLKVQYFPYFMEIAEVAMRDRQEASISA